MAEQVEKKRSGWRTAGIIAGVGCLSMIVVVVGGVIIAAMYARATLANLGDPDPKPVERRIALPSPVVNTTRKPGASGADSGALRLTLDLREGDFTIQPGEPGNAVQVRGEFAPGLYELVETQDTDAATGVRRATVRFRSKAPAWARFFAGIGGGSDARPHLTVIIPRGSPLDLNLQMAMGRSEIDLGGLTLGEVSVNATMGEHSIDFHEPVVEGLRELRINTSMGNVVLENLGNARADTITASGSMGNVTANLGGAWPAGATSSLTFEQSMGELTLRVPTTVRLDADVRSSQGGETKSRTTQDAKPPDDPNAPTLRVRVNSSMGEARVIRY
jgi:hypothetical protein